MVKAAQFAKNQRICLVYRKTAELNTISLNFQLNKNKQ